MNRSTLALLLGLQTFGLFAGPARASEEDDWARALEIPCHPLVTAVECRAYRDTLARLPDGAERQAYQAHHAALLAERSKSCGCARAQNHIGALRYR